VRRGICATEGRDLDEVLKGVEVGKTEGGKAVGKVKVSTYGKGIAVVVV